jgi:hypothetical protein
MINKLWLWLRFHTPLVLQKTRARHVTTAVRLEDGIRRARKREYFRLRKNA